MEIDKQIKVKYVDNTFKFYDNTNKLIGYFTSRDLAQFMFSLKLFQKNIENEINNIIEQFIISKENLQFKSHLVSPFMGNIGLLITLNNDLTNYIKKSFDDDTKMFSPQIKTKMKYIVNHLSYNLMNHTLFIINMIIDEIKNDIQRKLLMDKLNHLSIKLLHEINLILNDDIKTLFKKHYKLKKIVNLHFPKSESLFNESKIIPSYKPKEEIKLQLKEEEEIKPKEEIINRYIETSDYVGT